MNLSETNDGFTNENHMRRSNSQNEKTIEIESGSCGDVRTDDTKQFPWVNDCDNDNV